MPEKKTLSGDWERAGHGTDEKIGARSNLLVKGDGKRVCLVSGNRPHLGKGLSVPERICTDYSAERYCRIYREAGDKKKLDGGEKLLMNIANKILQNDFFVCKGL